MCFQQTTSSSLSKLLFFKMKNEEMKHICRKRYSIELEMVLRIQLL